MAETDFTENKTAQVGAAMATVGAFGKTAAVSKAIGVTASLKGGALVGGFLSPPLAIGIGLGLIFVGATQYLIGKRKRR